MTIPSRSFSGLLAVITDAGGGLTGFRRYIEAARAAALAEPDNAAAWMLLVLIAERFTRERFEEPITVEDSREAFERLRHISGTLDDQFDGGDLGRQLSGLNLAAAMLAEMGR